MKTTMNIGVKLNRFDQPYKPGDRVIRIMSTCTVHIEGRTLEDVHYTFIDDWNTMNDIVRRRIIQASLANYILDELRQELFNRQGFPT